MDIAHCFSTLRNKLPLAHDHPFLVEFEKRWEVVEVEKNETLIRYQTDNKKMFFIVSGSFIRSIISSRGEEKTVMFHTAGFLEFMKAYDTIYFHEKTNYEVKAAESLSLSFLIMTFYTRARRKTTTF